MYQPIPSRIPRLHRIQQSRSGYIRLEPGPSSDLQPSFKDTVQPTEPHVIELSNDGSTSVPHSTVSPKVHDGSLNNARKRRARSALQDERSQKKRADISGNSSSPQTVRLDFCETFLHWSTNPISLEPFYAPCQCQKTTRLADKVIRG